MSKDQQTRKSDNDESKPWYREHWVITGFLIGFVSYLILSAVLYRLLMHGFGLEWASSYDRASATAALIQATLAAAGLLAVSGALLAIARNTDKTYVQQLEQQKWQRREEFTQFAENVLQLGLTTYAEVAHSIVRQVGKHNKHHLLLKEKTLDSYLSKIELPKWDKHFTKHLQALYTNLHARALANAPIWKAYKNPENDDDALDLRRYVEPSSALLNALISCGTFAEPGDQKFPSPNAPNDIYYNPFYAWLHKSYYTRFDRPKNATQFKTSRFVVILAVLDLLPGLLSIIAYLEQYHYRESGGHEMQSKQSHLERFQQYLHIPALKTLIKIHGIEDEEGLYKFLKGELSVCSQFVPKLAAKQDKGRYELTETRRKELRFWLGSFAVHAEFLYSTVLTSITGVSDTDNSEGRLLVEISRLCRQQPDCTTSERLAQIMDLYRYKVDADSADAPEVNDDAESGATIGASDGGESGGDPEANLIAAKIKQFIASDDYRCLLDKLKQEFGVQYEQAKCGLDHFMDGAMKGDEQSWEQFKKTVAEMIGKKL